MQPLGSAALTAAYNAKLFTSHDYRLEAEVLNASGRVLASATLLDGQVNFERSATVRRTASFTLSDPFGSLALDPDGPWEGAPFASQQIRVRHLLSVPGFGEVPVTAFVGPVVTLNRRGPEVDIDCQDRTFYAIRGKRPLTVHRGRNAISAIRQIMSQRAGETKFRLPQGTRGRLTKAYSVGWADEASPWAVCRRIASAHGWQLLYSNDGYLTVRQPSPRPVLTLDTEQSITQLPEGALDITDWSNYARETGNTAGKANVWAHVALPPQHRMSPQALARNGVPMYLPILESDSGLKTKRAALVRAGQLLAPFRSMTRDMAITCVPFFHADVDDRIRLRTPDGSFVVPLSVCSIPMGAEEMSIGSKRVVSQIRGRAA